MENRRKDKHQNFLRIASIRTEKVIQRVERLAHCANKVNYEYSAEEAEQIFAAIDEALTACRAAFKNQKKGKRAAFSFGKPLPGQMSLEGDQSEGDLAEPDEE